MTLNAVCGIYFTSNCVQDFSAAVSGNRRSSSFHLCVLVSHGSSLLTLPSRINSPIPLRSVLFRLSLRRQNLYHRGQLLPLGNICMSASLSASFSVSICHPSIVFYPCFLAPSFILPSTVRLSLIVLWKTRDRQ